VCAQALRNAEQRLEQGLITPQQFAKLKAKCDETLRAAQAVVER
jgi:hypothetical protein